VRLQAPKKAAIFYFLQPKKGEKRSAIQGNFYSRKPGVLNLHTSRYYLEVDNKGGRNELLGGRKGGGGSSILFGEKAGKW